MNKRNQVIAAVMGLLSAAAVLSGCMTSGGKTVEGRWWKGVTHVHSVWSDGSSYPEMVALWYKTNGYNFVAVTDHNVVQKGEKWKRVNGGQSPQLDEYRSAFGGEWVKTRDDGTNLQVMCRQLAEYREKIEEPGRFIIIGGEELTTRANGREVHVVAVNTREYISPAAGSNVVDTIIKNAGLVDAQSKEKKQKMISILCHPNWGRGPWAEEIWPHPEVRFFEVINWLPYMEWNTGNKVILSTDKLWDVVLAKRAEAGIKAPMFGVAGDDMHKISTDAGCAWIMVRAENLVDEEITAAMQRGDFYASTGVVLKDFGMRAGRYFVEIDPENGVDYTIQFIGTPENYDRSKEHATDAGGKLLPSAERYSQDVGKIFSESRELSASYKPSGKELYVRAKIISSKKITGPKGETAAQSAWTQPEILR